MYGIIIARFLLKNSEKKVWFFEETFLLANISIEVILRMLFLTLSNANVLFGVEKLTSRYNTSVEALLIAKQIKLINKHKFIKTALDKNFEIFIVYIAALKALESALHPFEALLLATL